MILIDLQNKILKASMTSGTENTPESLSASRAVKSYLKQNFPNCTIIHSKNHFECSGFIRCGEKVVYYSSGDYRGTTLNYGFLIRTAKDEKDFTGGTNHMVTLSEIISTIKTLLSK